MAAKRWRWWRGHQRNTAGCAPPRVSRRAGEWGGSVLQSSWRTHGKTVPPVNAYRGGANMAAAARVRPWRRQQRQR
ncbi:hypothetical protein X777_16461 [Ooceraea biroi]|uniref:Uncharacterized protein n=1 Tax=Ooceraea biroi TaxID=2015173 RepID=A0A026VWI8_OOCBI|nr:hypothetical protein X777_16461 [Ooceraea biroi]